jgi:hypothetical protein
MKLTHVFLFSPSFFYPTQQILYSSAVHEKLAVMISEEVERKVQERLQQVREDTTAQLTRETSFMSTFVNGAIQRIEDKVRQDYSLQFSFFWTAHVCAVEGTGGSK